MTAIREKAKFRMRDALTLVLTLYLGVGSVFAFISVGSAFAFYTFGPGSWIGFPHNTISFAFAMAMAFLRILTWPLLLYVWIMQGFWETWNALFYLWY